MNNNLISVLAGGGEGEQYGEEHQEQPAANHHQHCDGSDVPTIYQKLRTSPKIPAV